LPDENENESNSSGEEVDGEVATNTTPTGTVANNVGQNDPKKNRKLAELKMSEPLRELLTFDFVLPGVYPGIKTNQFIWVPVKDDFYDEMYAEILEEMGPNKFNRYAGFEKGRFYISKKKWEYDIENGVKTSLTVNPIPSMYSEYMKMQLEAERALDQAIIDATKPKGGGVTTNASGVDCDPNDSYNSGHWAQHRCKPPKCTESSKMTRGNSSRQYAKDTAAHNGSSRELVEYVSSQVQYELYGDNPKGESRCPEMMWTGDRPIRGNCADFARLLKCILDVNGYQSMICHIPKHYYNAIWENGGWTVCDLCHHPAYGHANHENEAGSVIPIGTWDNPYPDGE
jgi:hypothetical protein